MAPQQQFDALLGLRPGITLLNEALACFVGDFCEQDDTTDGGRVFNFPDRGVRLFSRRGQCSAPQAVISAVHLTVPCEAEIPCGIRLGTSKAEALAIVRGAYPVIAEHQDAIYFQPTACDDLRASVEFWDEDVVVGIELFASSC